MNAALSNKAEIFRSLCQASKNLGFIAVLENLSFVKQLARIYSLLLEEQISSRRTLKFLHAQMAVFFLIMPANMSLGLRALFLLWAGLACWQCREAK